MKNSSYQGEIMKKETLWKILAFLALCLIINPVNAVVLVLAVWLISVVFGKKSRTI